MPNKIVKNKKQYMLGGQGVLNSQAGDEAWADAFSTVVTGLDTSWNTPIDFNSQVPTGLTVVSGRVTEVDLRDMRLSGDVDITEWENLKQCTLINITFNAFDSQYPSAIHGIGGSLEYLYLSITNTATYDFKTIHPHEADGDILHAGKRKTDEENIWHGDVPTNIDNLTNLKWFSLAWTDDWSGGGSSPTVINGIQSIPQSVWNISTLEYINIYENWNISEQGNTFEFPNNIGHITNLKYLLLGGGSGTAFDDPQGFMTTTYPSDIDQLTQMVDINVPNHPDLSGFPDLRNSGASLKNLVVKNTDITGTMPAWLVDGTLSELVHALLAPSNWVWSSDPFKQTPGGFTGTIPEFGDMNLYLWSIRYHAIEGPIPQSFWDNDSSTHRKINWMFTNITSVGKQDLTNQTGDINTLRWKYCKIGPEPIPYVNWSKTSFTSVWFQGNYYTFSDFLYVPPNAPNGETCIDLYKANVSQSVTYSPQRPLGSQSDYDSGTGIIDFSNVFTHADNVYEWQKDGATISGETTASIDTNSYGAGDYQLIVTNAGLSDLTLNSIIITV